MHKAIVAGLAAVLAVALSTSIAAARTGIAVTPSGSILTLNLNLDMAGIDVQCTWTLDLALHARTNKSVSSLVGFVDIAISTGRCSEGDQGLLAGGSRVIGAQGPYHLSYVSFSGTLPNITSVRWLINDVTFWLRTPGGTECLTNGAVDIRFDTTGGTTIEGAGVGAQNIPLVGGFLCGLASMTLEGNGDLSTNLTLSLF